MGAALSAPAAYATFPGENGKIAFRSGTACSSSGCEYDIFSANYDGTGSTNLTHRPGTERVPSWSPDGAKIAFAANYSGKYDLYVMNADGSGITQLADTPGDEFVVRWTSDGSKLVFDSGGVIYSIEADGTGLTPLAGPNAGSPAWSPDQTQIAFDEPVTCNGRCSRIVVMDADGTHRRSLTSGSSEDLLPMWSPDGSTIGFVRSGALTSEQRVYLMNPDGTGQRLLDNDPTCWIDQREYPGGWSPVDDRLSLGWETEGDCIGNGGAESWIRTIRKDGTDRRSVLWMGGFLSGPLPIFSPDGTRLAVDDGAGRVFTIRSTDGGDYHILGSEFPDWQPILRGYARPKGATPVRLSLVPASEPCTASNRTHGAPLAFPSCSPPVSTSSTLTVGVGDGSPADAKSIGSVRLDVVPGNVNIRTSLTNVMQRSDLSDYTGELRLELPLRITDHLNIPYPGGPGPGTVTDTSFFATVPCTATADTTLGGACSLVSSADALLPGSTPAGARSVWALDQVKVYDGNGALFATQGVFVP